MLTELNILTITETIDKAEISFSHLRDELIDHVCCEIECQMENGTNFQEAFSNIKSKIGIRDLQIVQENTLLLIDKQYRIMKKTMKIFGVIAPILMALGGLFKIMHWPLAGPLVTLGFFLSTFLFLPSAVYVSYTEISNRTRLFAHISGFFAAFLFSLGVLFKIMHWPGAKIALVGAGLVAIILFAPALFINQVRHSTNRTKKIALIIAFIGAIVYFAGFLSKLNNWHVGPLLSIVGVTLLIAIAFPFFAMAHFKEREYVSNSFIFVCFALMWIVLPTMLLSLKNARDPMELHQRSGISTGIYSNFLENQNVRIYNKLTETSSTADSINIKNMRTQSEQLIAYLHSVKAKIINQTLGTSYDYVTIKHFNVNDMTTQGNYKVCYAILINEGEALRIKDKLNQFREFIFKSNLDSSAKAIISDILTTSAPTNVPDFVNTWEKYYLLGSNSIITSNNISAIAENTLNAEHIALKSIRKRQLQALALK